jgi:hypothetical protein
VYSRSSPSGETTKNCELPRTVWSAASEVGPTRIFTWSELSAASDAVRLLSSHTSATNLVPVEPFAFQLSRLSPRMLGIFATSLAAVPPCGKSTPSTTAESSSKGPIVEQELGMGTHE